MTKEHNNKKNTETKGNLTRLAAGTLIATAAIEFPAIAVIGPLADFAFNKRFKNQKLERLENLLKILSTKVYEIDKQQIEERWNTEEFLDIFEDAVMQTVRCLNPKRLEYIAAILKKSLTEDEIEYQTNKKILEILGELNDVEIIVLQSFDIEPSLLQRREIKASQPKDNKSEEEFYYERFYEVHRNIFNGTENESETQKNERKVMLSNYKAHLINLGLIGPDTYSNYSFLFLTSLGGMLLKAIGVKRDIESTRGTQITPLRALDYYRESKLELQRTVSQKEREFENWVSRQKRDFERAASEIKSKLRHLF